MNYIKTQVDKFHLSLDDIREIRTRYRDLRKQQYNTDSIHLLSELYDCSCSDICHIVTSTDFPEIFHTTTRVVFEDRRVLKLRLAKIRSLILQGLNDKAIVRQLQCSSYTVKKQRKEMMQENSYGKQ